MIRRARKKVVSIDYRDNTGPSAKLFPRVATATLECGHRSQLGLVDRSGQHYSPVKVACAECPGAREVGRSARITSR